MTAARRILVTVGFVALLGVGGYETQFVVRQRARLRAVQREAQDLARELQALRAAREAEPHANATSERADATVDPEESPVLVRLRQLRQFLADNPSQRIPELALLSTLEWLDVAKPRGNEPSATFWPGELPFLAEELRFKAKEKFARLLWGALNRYKQERGGMLPADLAELAPFFESAPDPAILQRYAVLHSGAADAMPRDTRIIEEKVLADEERDRRLYFTSFVAWNWDHPANALNSIIAHATWEFAKANRRKPTQPEQLLPYLEADEKKFYDLPTLQRFWDSPLRRDPLPHVSESDTIRVTENADGVPHAEIVRR
jgi:hypothetical protein